MPVGEEGGFRENNPCCYCKATCNSEFTIPTTYRVKGDVVAPPKLGDPYQGVRARDAFSALDDGVRGIVVIISNLVVGRRNEGDWGNSAHFSTTPLRAPHLLATASATWFLRNVDDCM